MNYNQQEHNEEKNRGHEPAQVYATQEALEEARLKAVLLMSDMERFKLFCRMMRIGKMLASAKVTHKPG